MVYNEIQSTKPALGLSKGIMISTFMSLKQCSFNGIFKTPQSAIQNLYYVYVAFLREI